MSSVGIVVGYVVAGAGGLVTLVSIVALQVGFAGSGRPETRREYGRWGWEERPPALWGALGGLAVFLGGMGLAVLSGAR